MKLYRCASDCPLFDDFCCQFSRGVFREKVPSEPTHEWLQSKISPNQLLCSRSISSTHVLSSARADTELISLLRLVIRSFSRVSYSSPFLFFHPHLPSAYTCFLPFLALPLAITIGQELIQTLSPCFCLCCHHRLPLGA